MQRFLEYLAGDRGYSRLTVRSYAEALESFRAFCLNLEDGLGWNEADSDVVRRWLLAELQRGVAPHTMRHRMSSLRSFYRYLMETGECSANPAAAVRNPKVAKPLPTFVKEREMERLFDGDTFGDGFGGRRDRLLLLLLYSTGIRAAELLGLTVADINLAAGELRVTGKRDKQRVVPFGAELSDALRAYMEERAALLRTAAGGSPAAEALFVRDDGSPLRYTDMRNIVRRQLAMVSTQKKKSPHVLRHTFATVMLNNGADLEAVRQLLGHESLAATEVYTHTTFAELKKEYEHAHPRA